MRDLGEDGQAERLLRLIAEGTAAVVGNEYLRALVSHLGMALAVRYAFIAEFADSRTRVRTLAFWADGRFLDNIEYDLAGTPCEAVLAGELRQYNDAVQERFPQDRALAEIRARSYLAIPLVDRGQCVMGHLAIIDDKPMQDTPRDLTVFRIFAARARAELERLQAEAALKRSEERLASILDSAMDAIITIDRDHHITLFNRAAERAFGCAAAWAIGQPFERFLARRSRGLLLGVLEAADRGSETVAGGASTWAPEGLVALRADRVEFPIEATLSPLTLGAERLYTIILRDVNERRKAEIEIERLRSEKRYLEEVVGSDHGFSDIVGSSAAMQTVFDSVDQVAPTDATVLLTGETGTGKELIARALHQRSPRKDKLLVKVNCAALPGDLIESELFGHEKGAFTGALAQRKGRFELADGGTLFLDEVAELSAGAQAKLLRVLQEQEFERVGGTRTLVVDVRVIAATNRDLEDMVQQNTFRTDLYYRLNVFPIRIPPLRERTQDIPALARHFLARYAKQLGRPILDFAPGALARLERYHWPGNVRELQNVIERSVVLTHGSVLALDERLGLEPEAIGEGGRGTLEEVERAHILRVLAEAHWVIEGPQGAAAILDLGPSTLRYRMQKLGIRRPGRISPGRQASPGS